VFPYHLRKSFSEKTEKFKKIWEKVSVQGGEHYLKPEHLTGISAIFKSLIFWFY